MSIKNRVMGAATIAASVSVHFVSRTMSKEEMYTIAAPRTMQVVRVIFEFCSSSSVDVFALNDPTVTSK